MLRVKVGVGHDRVRARFGPVDLGQSIAPQTPLEPVDDGQQDVGNGQGAHIGEDDAGGAACVSGVGGGAGGEQGRDGVADMHSVEALTMPVEADRLRGVQVQAVAPPALHAGSAHDASLDEVADAGAQGAETQEMAQT